MQRENKFGENVIGGNYEGRFLIKKRDHNDRNYTEYVFTRSPNTLYFYGTEKDNEILPYDHINFLSPKFTSMYGGSGSDTFLAYMRDGNMIVDFNDTGDRIALSQIEGLLTNIVKGTHDTSMYYVDLITVKSTTIFGDRKGEVTQATLDEAINGRNEKVFTFR